MDWWRLLHILGMIWLGAGLGAVYLPILRAWATKDLDYQMHCVLEAARSETRVLLPGAMATGVTGFFWGMAANYNMVHDAWFGLLAVLFVIFWLVCLPLLGFGLRRARLAVLIAQKKGERTPELQEILDDRVPLVFGTILTLSVPLMAWIAVFKPI
jgi:hypothetical protein